MQGTRIDRKTYVGHFHGDLHGSKKCTTIIVVVSIVSLVLLLGIGGLTGVIVASTTVSNSKTGCTADFECNNQNPCVESSCVEGKCQENKIENCCTSNVECESNTCYRTFCDPSTFTCKLLPPANGTTCDDYNFCTVNDRCSGYKCMGAPMMCETDNVCSTGTCRDGIGCVFNSVKDGQQCFTNDKCHTANFCKNGICTLGPVKNCSHFDTQCSRGVCDSTSGECVRVAINERDACDDGMSCTIQDQCHNSYCVGQEDKCYDNNPCTINKCVESIGCMLKYESFNKTCSATCLDTSDCPTDDNWICADGTCVVMDYAGSQIRFIDYEIEICPAGGHKLVMDFVLDTHPYQIGNDTRYILPKSMDDITAHNQDLGFIQEKRSMQTLIIANDIARTAFTLTTACQNVTQNNCDSIFAMRQYQFHVELYHCISVSPNEENCIDTNMAVAASIDLSLSDCTLFPQHHIVPLYGTGVLYSEGVRYTGVVEDTVVRTGTDYITIGFESPAYTNPHLIAMTTNLRICRPDVSHYLKDCVSGKDPNCLLTGCFQWDPNDSPIIEYHDVVVDGSVTAMAKTVWETIACYNEDDYNSPSTVICETNKCPNTPNGNNVPWVAPMDDGFRLNVKPIRSEDLMPKEWTFDLEFRLYACNHTLRSSHNIYHNVITLVL